MVELLPDLKNIPYDSNINFRLNSDAVFFLIIDVYNHLLGIRSQCNTLNRYYFKISLHGKPTIEIQVGCCDDESILML